MSASLKPERVSFDTEDGVRLEAFLYRPSSGEDAQGRFPAAAIVHPHSKMGGSAWNNVVVTVAESLTKAGAMALCVNFRGVGSSSGHSTWKGNAEVADVKASIDFLRRRTDVRSLFIVGYSFGSAVSTTAAVKYHASLDGVVLLSPPCGFPSNVLLGQHFKNAPQVSDIPKLVVAGNRDAFSSEQATRKMFERLPDPKRITVIDEASHFWHGEEDLAAEPVVRFVKENDARICSQ